MSRNPKNVLQIAPHVLEFTGPFDRPVSTVLTIGNPTESHVAFKIKVTAPRAYNVRPVMGALEPRMMSKVVITLKAVESNIAERNRDRFVVQSVIIPSGQFILEQLWKHVSERDIMMQKLNCSLRVPEGVNCHSPRSEQDSGLHENSVCVLPPKEVEEVVADPKKNELARSQKENEKLKKEAASLRQENLCIQDEIYQRMSSQIEFSLRKPSSWVMVSESRQVTVLPNPVICFFVIMFLFGLIIGKWAF